MYSNRFERESSSTRAIYIDNLKQFYTLLYLFIDNPSYYLYKHIVYTIDNNVLHRQVKI